LGKGETYQDLLADKSAYENFDADSYFNGRGFGFVRLNQLAMEHLMGAR
jgi:xylose isomerase